MSRPPSAARPQLLFELYADLTKLQQQYRRAKETKRGYTAKTQALIHRDEQDIWRLHQEHEELLCRVTHSVSNQCDDPLAIQDLLVQGDGTDDALEAEKSKVTSLRNQILRYKSELAEQKSVGATSCSVKRVRSNFPKSLRRAEHKLCNVKTSFQGQKSIDKVMERNGELREEVKVLQMEKKSFFQIKSQMEKELHAMRKQLSNLMTKCTEAFNDRTKVEDKRRLQSDQKLKDVAQYIREKSNLEQEMSHYCYFEDFLDRKGIARINQEDDMKADTCRQTESKVGELEGYENVLKQILTETESDLDTSIRKFIEVEEQNYTLLNLLNHQYNEIEANERQISQLCSEIEIFEAEEQEQEEQLQELVAEGSIEQQTAEKQLAVYQQCVEIMEKRLDLLKEGVALMHQKCYDSSDISCQMGPSHRDEGENIIESLMMVDDRVNQLLNLQCYLEFLDNPMDPDCVSIVAGQLLGVTMPAVRPTSASSATTAPDDDPDMVEAALLGAKEPMRREDLLTLTSERIQKKKTDGPDVQPV